MSTAVIYFGYRKPCKIDLDLDSFKLEDATSSDMLNFTTLYFIGPKNVLTKFYPKADSTEIAVEFITDRPHGQYPSVMISPTRNGEDYEWSDLYIEDFDAVHKLIDIGLKKLEENNEVTDNG